MFDRFRSEPSQCIVDSSFTSTTITIRTMYHTSFIKLPRSLSKSLPINSQ